MSPINTPGASYVDQYQALLSSALSKLAGGSQLTGDSDPAGIAVSGSLTARLDQLQSANGGASDIVSVAQTTDGFLSSIQTQLTQLGTLAMEATNTALGPDAQNDYAAQFNDLVDSINSTATNASFNGVPLFTNQSLAASINADGETDTLDLSTVGTAASLGLTGLSVSDPTSAQNAISQINNALAAVTNRRAEIGADASKFNFYITNMDTEADNIAAAQSQISDLDVAFESTQLSQDQIQSKASVAMLAQSNSDAKSVLDLLS